MTTLKLTDDRAARRAQQAAQREAAARQMEAIFRQLSRPLGGKGYMSRDELYARSH